MERRLWDIPMSDIAWSDAVPQVIEKDDIGELYRFYERYIDHIRADARKQ